MYYLYKTVSVTPEPISKNDFEFQKLATMLNEGKSKNGLRLLLLGLYSKLSVHLFIFRFRSWVSYNVTHKET